MTEHDIDNMPYWKAKLRFTQLEKYQKHVEEQIKKSKEGNA